MTVTKTIAAASLLLPLLATTALADSRFDASVTQIGNLNVSFADQRADVNKFKLKQKGRGNTALVIQNGRINDSSVQQLGIINVTNTYQRYQKTDNEPGPGYLFTYSQDGFNYAVASMTPMSFTRIGRFR